MQNATDYAYANFLLYNCPFESHKSGNKVRGDYEQLIYDWTELDDRMWSIDQ